MTNRAPQIEALARLAEVEPEFVADALAAGALGKRSAEELTAEDETPLRLLAMWESAGFPVDAVAGLIEAGLLSYSFLAAPSITGPPRVESTYQEYAARSSVDMKDIDRLQEALGLEPPLPDDQMREGDTDVIELFRATTSAGIDPAAALRLFRVYADGLRRLGQAEADLYEAEIEEPARATGADEEALLALGGQVGHQLVPLIERAILAIYRRLRQHVWLDHTLGHVEAALDRAGLVSTDPRPPSVVFVDLTGFTGLTEEFGDSAAAEMAGTLASLVEAVSRRHDGRPVRWLGDGGMFVFRNAGQAIAAALETVDQAPQRGLPPTHVGVHAGPLIFQDGDIYGRTVNLAARLSALAGPGEVLVSETVVDLSGDGYVFEPVGPVQLKGMPGPTRVFRARSPG